MTLSIETKRVHLSRLFAMAGLLLAVTACDTTGMQDSSNPPRHYFSSTAPAAGQEVFATPEQAVDGLVTASRNGNTAEVQKILGPAAKKLLHSGDKVADRSGREKFLAAYDKAHALENVSETRRELVVGSEQWPLPIPVVYTAKEGWWWDTPAGADEILNRRIGRNELNVLEVCRAYVEAQREYGASHRTEHHKREYAQRFFSTEGKQDGLYWETADGADESPLGPLIAAATAEGYSEKAGIKHHEPYHGYYFKILAAQGDDAAGGARNYVKDGNMTGGFALVAYPAQYGNSGVMTFIVNHNGIVYEKNFGKQSAEIAGQMKVYDPDSSWKVVEDQSE